MAVPPNPSRLSLPVAPLAAGIIGVLTAAMFALVPTDLLESMVVDSGIASVLSAAEPPLGMTARLGLVLACGGGVGLIAWFGLFLLFGARTIQLQGAGTGEAPVLRRADAHPDAPARRPLFANTDLGTPFLEVRARPVHVDAAQVTPVVAKVKPLAAPPAERPLPADLDLPLAAFDPGALPEAPVEWTPPAPKVAVVRHVPTPVAPVIVAEPAPKEPAPIVAAPEPAKPAPIVAEPAPLEPAPIRRQTFDPGERFETFPLTPMVRPEQAPRPIVRDTDPAETVQALLDRLERVAARRETTRPAPPIEDALSALRQMAVGRG